MSEFVTITQLNKTIKQLFEQTPFLKRLSVLGEISNFKRHSTGTLYFTLKDADSELRVIMFQSMASKLNFQPTNGQQVIATGDVGVYEARGEYQLYAQLMRPHGAGDIYAKLEALKAQLQKEGLLASALKQPLPKYPRVVGVITSPTGAAIQDIEHTIARRFPLAILRVYPALVQGEEAKHSIVAQLQKANAEGVADVLIVGRGGGSIEDLWAFNEEIVVRAIAASTIPIISAVGHETDTTLADLVADMRAPTPTAAAEMAVPDQADLLQSVATTVYHLQQSIAKRWQSAYRQFERYAQSYVFTQPERLLQGKEYAFDRVLHRLQQRTPHHQLERWVTLHAQQRTALITRFDQRVTRHQQRSEHLHSTLQALNPKAVLERGYAMVEHDGVVVDSVQHLQPEQTLEVTFKDGHVETQVKHIRRS